MTAGRGRRAQCAVCASWLYYLLPHLPITCTMIVNPHLARAWAGHLVTVDVVPTGTWQMIDDR